jgi:plastocyanin
MAGIRALVRMSTRIGMVALALGLVGTVGACGDDSSSGDDASGSGSGVSADEAGGESVATITAVDISFDPTELTVGAGDTITLHNEDDVEHSFTIDDADVDGEAEGGEDADIVMPDQPGTYDFYCRYHPDQMQGTLTVE